MARKTSDKCTDTRKYLFTDALTSPLALPRYQPALECQQSTATQCFRFMDADQHYHQRHLHLLLRALQQNPKADRALWFTDVRSCKRRAQTPLGGRLSKHNIAELFSIDDEYNLLQYRAMVSSVRSRIAHKGLFLLDAFRGFDVDRDGSLNCTELYSGLRWLGLNVTPALVHNIMRTVDTSGDGKISFKEFHVTFSHADGSPDTAVQAPFARMHVPQHRIPELSELNRERSKGKSKSHNTAPLKALHVRVVAPPAYKQIWSGALPGRQGRGAAFQPTTEYSWLERQFKKDRKLMCVGHYLTVGAAPAVGCVLEVSSDSNPLVRSVALKAALRRFFPHPQRYHLAWTDKRGPQPLYAWEPVQPKSSVETVALGLVFTNSKAPPPLDAVHCVPKVRVCEGILTHS